MSLHEFTVHIAPVPDDAGLDRLYEAGLDDALPEVEARRCSLHVSREAETLAHAIVTVVEQVETAGFHATGVVSEDLVTLSQIGERVGRTRESVRLLAVGRRGPGGFPAPAGGGHRPLYSWASVRDWFHAWDTDKDAQPPRQQTWDQDQDTLTAADLLLRARLLLDPPSELTQLVNA